MKETIYTIPVMDAFKESNECPFCYMYHTLETQAINFVLGPSYMETDVREKTNELGFCKEHLTKLYSQKNRLGLALMLHSHMDVTKHSLEKLLTDPVKKPKKSFLKKEASEQKLTTYLKEQSSKCYICDKVQDTFNRYVDTFFYLWKKDKTFVDLVKTCKGFCLEHFADIYQEGPKHLNDHALKSFLDTIVPIQLDNLQRVQDDLDWFIKKSDYRFADEPWKNSRDALVRSMVKSNSLITDED
ncbi:hypothetical protein HZI73_10590 [Vallitalea pronyensis]|uniref:ABC transporter substrate-binding protein n=1 Tax=Vallitalea pronyensis TaxID=1348613 RepID=A0A8J8MJ04_9FIRM|nr:DUF6062 family protein [Vallitalea pronyensis]QUI22712.1 hypothetical protein HZI73_10590 [Vallitalea pronyensis]